MSLIWNNYSLYAYWRFYIESAHHSNSPHCFRHIFVWNAAENNLRAQDSDTTRSLFSFCREPQAVHLTGGYTENLSADFPYGTVRRKYKIFFLLPVTPKIRCGEHKKNPAAEKPTGTVSGFCRVSPLYRNILKKKLKWIHFVGKKDWRTPPVPAPPTRRGDCRRDMTH